MNLFGFSEKAFLMSLLTLLIAKDPPPVTHPGETLFSSGFFLSFRSSFSEPRLRDLSSAQKALGLLAPLGLAAWASKVGLLQELQFHEDIRLVSLVRVVRSFRLSQNSSTSPFWSEVRKFGVQG